MLGTDLGGPRRERAGPHALVILPVAAGGGADGCVMSYWRSRST
jgi:hypothetical protein